MKIENRYLKKDKDKEIDKLKDRLTIILPAWSLDRDCHRKAMVAALYRLSERDIHIDRQTLP